MATNKAAQNAAGRVYKSEGAVRPPKWERARPAYQIWCNLCGDYTEHDHMGCVECYDPNLDPEGEALKAEKTEGEEETK